MLFKSNILSIVMYLGGFSLRLEPIIGWGITIVLSLIVLYIALSILDVSLMIAYAIGVLIIAALASSIISTNVIVRYLMFITTVLVLSIIIRSLASNTSISSGVLLAIIVLLGMIWYIKSRGIS